MGMRQVWAVSCLETVHQRPCMMREIETWLSDSRVGNNSVVDHRSRPPVLSVTYTACNSRLTPHKTEPTSHDGWPNRPHTTDTARIVMQSRVYETVVCLSVCPCCRQQQVCCCGPSGPAIPINYYKMHSQQARLPFHPHTLQHGGLQ